MTHDQMKQSAEAAAVAIHNLGDGIGPSEICDVVRRHFAPLCDGVAVEASINTRDCEPMTAGMAASLLDVARRVKEAIASHFTTLCEDDMTIRNPPTPEETERALDAFAAEGKKAWAGYVDDDVDRLIAAEKVVEAADLLLAYQGNRREDEHWDKLRAALAEYAKAK